MRMMGQPSFLHRRVFVLSAPRARESDSLVSSHGGGRHSSDIKGDRRVGMGMAFVCPAHLTMSGGGRREICDGTTPTTSTTEPTIGCPTNPINKHTLLLTTALLIHVFRSPKCAEKVQLETF